MKEITLAAVTENIYKVTEFVEAQLEKMDCSMRAMVQINVAVDELFTNIASYAYPEGEGEATVRIEREEENAAVRITFIDSGIPFDPTQNPDPDVTLSAEERGIGGLGIYMVKKTMDEMRYEYKDGQNVLTIVKKI